MTATLNPPTNAVELKRLEEIPKSESINALIYGPAGCGKTAFAASAGDRSLFINNGMGIETLYKFNVNPIVATVGYDDIQKTAQIYDLIKTIIETALKVKKEEFDTIIIDDGTAFKRASLHKAVELNQIFKGTKSLGKSRDNDVLVPDVNDYGAEMALTESFISETCAIAKYHKKNFILCAHERLTFKSGKVGEQPSLIKQTPYFTGVDKSPDYITGYFDWVLHFETLGGGANRVYRCRTEGDSILTAKVRNNTFPEIILNPNFLRMLQFHREGKGQLINNK